MVVGEVHDLEFVFGKRFGVFTSRIEYQPFANARVVARNGRFEIAEVKIGRREFVFEPRKRKYRLQR
jgi:hypothetical protein